MLSFLPFAAAAQMQMEVDGMVFYPNYDENGQEDGTCCLQEYKGNDAVVTIPETIAYDGRIYTVTIVAYAFSNNNDITEVILPSSITEIGASAFSRCKNLKNINLPEGLSKIGDYAFEWCAFEEIILPSTLQELGVLSFSYCDRLSSIVIPKSIKKIENWTFQRCRSLENVDLNEGLEEIGKRAFQLTGIKSIQLPSTLKTMGEEAFAYSNIAELNIPGNIEELGDGCFYINSLKSLSIEKGESPLKLGNNCFNEYNYYLTYLSINRDLQVENGMFCDYKNLNSIVLGENATDLSWLEPSSIYNLRQIVSSGSTPPTIGKFTPEQYANVYVYVPVEYRSKYENDQNWAFFSNITGLEIPYTDYSISVEPKEITINVGEWAELIPNVSPAINSSIDMSVDPNGSLIVPEFGKIYSNTACEGDVTFTLMLNNKKAVCHVTVLQPATSVVLNKKEMTLQKGETANVLVNVGPVDVSDPTVTWSSSNQNVATVDNGLITAVGGGECDIVATTHNGLTATCHVSVPVAPEQISFESAEVSAIIGDNVTLNAILAPDDVTEKALTWATSDAEVATVENGVVSCIGLGEAVITATTVNGLSAECKITVNPIMAESITLDRTEVETQIGETFTLTATISPDDTTDKSVTWTSSDTNVASVEAGVVTCVGVGEAVITATTVNGLTATCAVTVTRILVESIVIDPSSIEGERGEQIQLTATVLPENATNKTLDWGSDDEFVAKVSETGLVTIMSERVTRIHARATDGSGVEATCEVTGVAGVDELFVDGKLWNVITPDGMLIRKNATKEDIEQLAPALYILTDGKRTVKLVKN